MGDLATSDLDQALTRLGAHSERLHALGDRLRGIRARESSPDGVIEIVVDGDGRPVELHLRPAVSRMSPKEFERELISAAERAAARAFAEHGDLVAVFNAAAVDSEGQDVESTAAQDIPAAAERSS